MRYGDTFADASQRQRDLAKERIALERGAIGFLHKPFYSEDIDRMLHVAFGLRQPSLIAKHDTEGVPSSLKGLGPRPHAFGATN